MTKRGTSDFKTFASANRQFINNGLKICSCQVSGGASLILSVYEPEWVIREKTLCKVLVASPSFSVFPVLKKKKLKY
jgi:hypothetical protein